MLHWRFHFEKEIPINCLIISVEVNIYIGFWTLTLKYSQYGLYGQATFKNIWSQARFGVGKGRVFSVLPLPATMTRVTLVGVFRETRALHSNL